MIIQEERNSKEVLIFLVCEFVFWLAYVLVTVVHE